MPETPASPASPPRAQTASFPPGQVTTPARIQCPEDRTREALRSIHIKENRTYKLYGDKYIAWFDEQLPDMKAKFKLKELHHRVSVIAVQYFFIEVVVPRKLTRKSALKYLYPLPKLSAREGSNIPLADMKTEAFLLQLQLIDTNCALRDKKNDDDGKGADGQEQMLSTEIMTQENLSKVLSTLLKSERKWECTAAEISTLSITLLRHDSILKVTLGKLYLTHLSPDGDTTPHDMKPYNCDLEPVLGIIVPKIDQVKKQHNDYSQRRTEIHGGFRHKRHERDYIAIVAMSLFVRLNGYTAKNVHFLKDTTATAASSTAASSNVNAAASIDTIDAVAATAARQEDEDNDDLANPRSAAASTTISTSKQMQWRKLPVFPSTYFTAYSAFKAASVAADVPAWEKVTHLK